MSIDKCANCFSDKGFYRKCKINGSGRIFYNFDGSLLENCTMHDDLNYVETKTLYCINCDKQIKELK